MSRRLALATLLFALLAAPARAGTVSQQIADGCFGDPTCQKYGQLQIPVTTFTAAPGETNSVTVSRAGNAFLVNDFASAVSVVAPCTQVDANTASCPFTEGIGGIPGLAVDAGDGDDAVTVMGDPGAESRLLGGDGNDSILGGDGNDEIDGGLGDDRLNGGAGFNVLSYETRTADVTVSLKAGTGGQADESDTLTGFQTLLSGSGVDVLLGGDADDTIDGGAGADNINGGAGADALFGNKGSDALRGGGGNDRLFGDPADARFSDDFLQGDGGNDELDDPGGRNTFLGGSGRDKIQGGKGRDTAKAGPGNDTLFMRGGSKDRVDCGKGRDRAKTDKKDTRKHCERR
jgi:Ca2+-binding RTX toxin-like protein